MKSFSIIPQRRPPDLNIFEYNHCCLLLIYKLILIDTFCFQPASVWTADNTNALGEELHAYAMAKYRFIEWKGFSVQAGAGIGLLNQQLDYPYSHNPGISNTTEKASFTDIEFPVSLEAYYLFRKRFGIGFKAGGFIEPDFPIVGIYIGPQLRIRL